VREGGRGRGRVSPGSEDGTAIPLWSAGLDAAARASDSSALTPCALPLGASVAIVVARSTVDHQVPFNPPPTHTFTTTKFVSTTKTKPRPFVLSQTAVFVGFSY
jgi:hypothetical protein